MSLCVTYLIVPEVETLDHFKSMKDEACGRSMRTGDLLCAAINVMLKEDAPESPHVAS